MRYAVAPAVLLFLAACGGGDTTQPTPPPPPPPPPSIQPGPPASVVVQAGDGQEAEPGATLTIKPAVLVKDAAGRPVPGVSVAFAVDSGGGSLVSAQATTAADGVAASGDWRLGPNQGSNVLMATVTGLTPVKIRASARLPVVTLLDSVAVAASGGTISYAKAGDPLSGVAITVPAGAFPAQTRFSVKSDPGIKAPLPAGVVQLGPAFVVGNGDGFARLPMALKLPVHAGGDTVIAAFYYEPVSGTLENVPLVARDAGSITMATRHFSAERLMVKGAPTAGLRQALGLGAATAASSVPFGQVIIIAVATVPAALNQPISSDFTPGVDDWEFTNNGTWLSTSGICAGMSVTALYYYYRFRPGGPPLNHRFDTFRALEWDNPDGERFASEIQDVGDWKALANWIITMQGYATGSLITSDQLYYESLALSIKVTRQPQLLALFSSTRNDGHAIVAIAVNNGTVSFADPNHPGTVRTTTYDNNGFAPILLALKATQSPDVMDEVTMVGVSSIVNVRDIDMEYSRFSAGQAGKSFPGIKHQMFDRLAGAWVTVPANDTIVTTGVRLALKSVKLVTPPNSDFAATNVRDSLNALLGQDDGVFDTAAVIPLRGTAASFRVSVETFVLDVDGFVDQRFLTIIARPFAITPATTTDRINVDLGFTATNSGLATSAWTFKWDFGDNTGTVTKTGDSTVVHRWTVNGTYTVKAEMRDPAGKLVGVDQATVIINPAGSILPRPTSGLIDVDQKLNFSIGAFPSGTVFTWTMDNGRHALTQVITNDSTYHFRPSEIGSYKVKVVARNAQGGVLGMDEITVTITSNSPWAVYELTNVHVSTTGLVAPPSPIFVQNRLNQMYTADTTMFNTAARGGTAVYMLYVDHRQVLNPDTWRQGLYLYSHTPPLAVGGPFFSQLELMVGYKVDGSEPVSDDPTLRFQFNGPSTLTGGTVTGLNSRRLSGTYFGPTAGVDIVTYAATSVNMTMSQNGGFGTFKYTYRWNPTGFPGADAFRWTFGGTFNAVRVR